MSSALRYVATSAAVVLALVLGACGGSDDDPVPTPAVAAPAAVAEAEPPVAQEPATEQDTSQIQLAQCLRDQGLDVPDTIDGEAFAQRSPAERRRLEEALEGPCREFQAGAFGDHSPTQSQGFLDAITAFTVCLRKEGVDVPDPDPSNPFAVLHSIDQSDPRIASAAGACQDTLAAINGGG